MIPRKHKGGNMADDFASIVAGAFPTKNGPITGISEWGLAAAIVMAGVGIYKLLSNSSIKAEGPIPPVNVGNVNLGDKS